MTYNRIRIYCVCAWEKNRSHHTSKQVVGTLSNTSLPTNTNICHTYYSSPDQSSIESHWVMMKSVLASRKPDKILLSHFYSNMKTATRFINILNLVLVVLILISIFGTYQQIKQTNENMKLYTCDQYAYNQDQAPSYCK